MQPPLVPPPISPSIMNPLFQTEAPPAQAQAASRPTWSTSAATSQKFTPSSPLRENTPTSAPPVLKTEREGPANTRAAPVLESELMASPTRQPVRPGTTDIVGSAKPAPESGVDGSIERLLSHETTNRPTPSRWTSPQTGALAPTSASNLLWQADKGKVVYHRKSSCDNCHSRKIKCDQTKPECGACSRRGASCSYNEDSPKSSHSQLPSQVQPALLSGERKSLHGTTTPAVRDGTVTIVSATDPAQRTVLPIPPTSATYKKSTKPVFIEYKSSHFVPGKMPLAPKRGGQLAASYHERKNREEMRKRIVDGFDFDSDESGDASPEEGPTESEAMNQEMTKSTSTGRDQQAEAASGRRKRTASKSSDGDPVESITDVNGELLELASGPPKKKKKQRASDEKQDSGPVSSKAIPPSQPISVSQIPNSSAPPQQPMQPQQQPPIPQPPHQHQLQPPPVVTINSYGTPLLAIMGQLPSMATQAILLRTFFADAFLAEGVSLLKPQFNRDYSGLLVRQGGGKSFIEGAAVTLALMFAVMACAVKIMPGETISLVTSMAPPNTMSLSSVLSTATVNRPVADDTPLDERLYDVARMAHQVAESHDPPSIMFVMLLLVLHRYSALRKDRMHPAGKWLVQAIKTAQRLHLNREFENLSQVERELRRRLMWMLYIEDRNHAYQYYTTYTILDAHHGVHMPSPMSDEELCALETTVDKLPTHRTEQGPTPCTALFVNAHLARKLVPLLDVLATLGPGSASAQDHLTRLKHSLGQFQDALPTYLRFHPNTDTRWDASHPYLPLHRLRLHHQILTYQGDVIRTVFDKRLFAVFSLGPVEMETGHDVTASRAPPPTYTSYCKVLDEAARFCRTTVKVQRSSKLVHPNMVGRLFSPHMLFSVGVCACMLLMIEKVDRSGRMTRDTGKSFQESRSGDKVRGRDHGRAVADRESLRGAVYEILELLNSIPNDITGKPAEKILRCLLAKTAERTNTLSSVPLKNTVKANGDETHQRRHSDSTLKSTSNSSLATNKQSDPAAGPNLPPRDTAMTAATADEDGATKETAERGGPSEGPGPAGEGVSSGTRPRTDLEKCRAWIEIIGESRQSLDYLLNTPIWEGVWDGVIAKLP